MPIKHSPIGLERTHERPLTNLFFEGTKKIVHISKAEYVEAEQQVKTLDTFAYLINQSFYVADFYKENFFYVSPNPLFLCGYSPHDAISLGYEFYGKIIHPDDLPMVIHIHKTVLEYFHKLPVNLRDVGFINFNFRILYNNHSLMVNHKVRPLAMSKSGNVWLAGCMVSSSTQKKPGNLFIHLNNQLVWYHYSFEHNKWENYPIPKLSEREWKILMLSAQGYTNDMLSKTFHLAESTIKNQKNAIFKKLNVSSTYEAIDIAINFKLIT